jgi:ketosteroid isomerase-like protein
MHDVGKYLVVWRKQPDGSYKIIRDIANSDLSPAK